MPKFLKPQHYTPCKLTLSLKVRKSGESGSGRADIMLLPKVGKQNNAIIIEYKISKIPEELESMAKTGLKQITDKQYDSKIKEHSHVKKIIKIAIAFCGKEAELQYQIDMVF